MTSPLTFLLALNLSLFLPISVILVQTIVVFWISLQQPPNYFLHISFIPLIHSVFLRSLLILQLLSCCSFTSNSFNGYSSHTTFQDKLLGWFSSSISCLCPAHFHAHDMPCTSLTLNDFFLSFQCSAPQPPQGFQLIPLP